MTKWLVLRFVDYVRISFRTELQLPSHLKCNRQSISQVLKANLHIISRPPFPLRAHLAIFDQLLIFLEI